jgi:hypothetical protein
MLYIESMTSVSGISAKSQLASIAASTKGAAAQAKYAAGVQAERDKVAKSIVAPERLEETRQNLSQTETFEADDTFAHTEGQKVRGGRLDLIV